MKISIRKHTFETNSSSNHSLILTNEKDMEKDKEKFEKELFGDDPLWENYCDGFLTPIKSVAEKAYFLNGVFNYENSDYEWMENEYKIFIKVLEDNNEAKILENIKLHNEQFKNSGCPYCDKFYGEGTLTGCNCEFRKKFNKYFKLIDIQDIYTLEDIFKMSSKELDKIYREIATKNINGLYQKIYDFLYKDGIIIPYEYL
jgi:hypothetical protein